MTLTQAIEKGIAGGWKESMEIDKIELHHERKPGNPDFYEEPAVYLYHADQYWIRSLSTILLDPRFMQALGRTEGWNKKMVVRRGTVIGNFCAPPNSGNRGECFEEMGFGMDYIPTWLFKQHLLLDALAEASQKPDFNMQQTIEDFFATLGF